jgi:hypothetical protein
LTPPGWHANPAIAAQVEETLSTLTVKRRRFLRDYLVRGNISDAVRRAGYNVTTVQSASQVGQEILRSPKVRFCVDAILEAEGLSGAKLRSILGHHLAGYDSIDAGDRDRSARVATMIYRHARPKPLPGTQSPSDWLLDQMTAQELENLAEHRLWPARFARYLRATATTDPPLLAPSDAPADGVRVPVAEAPAGAASRASVDDAPLPPDDARPYHDRAPVEAPEAAQAVGRGAEPLSPFEHQRAALARQERELKAATSPPLDPALRTMAIRDRKW